MTAPTPTLSVDAIDAALATATPGLDEGGRRLAAAVLRLLAAGEPVSVPAAADGRQRVGLDGVWLLLVPAACCGGPLLVAGLAAASALAGGALGLALAALLVGGLTVNRPHRRARAARGADGKPEEAKPAS